MREFLIYTAACLIIGFAVGFGSAIALYDYALRKWNRF